MTRSNPSRTLLRAVLGLACVLAVTFGPAGTLAWPAAWILIAGYGVYLVVLTSWLRRARPELAAERGTRHPDTAGWDRHLLRVYSLALIAIVVVAGLDAVRLRLSRVPIAVQVVGFAGSSAAAALSAWALACNDFASAVVRIQRERGQTVCSTGPYARVRHPMYVAVALLVSSVPLALGSYYALVPAAVVVGVFVVRTTLEDRTLTQALPGYATYAEAVRHRWIPGVW